MSRDFEADRPMTLASLRAGAALAVVLAVGGGAFAQSAPENGPAPDVAPETASADAPEPQAAGTAGKEDSKRDRVYVLGRRVVASVATIDAEEAPQVVNVITAETLMEQGVASLEQALRNVPGITTQIGEGGVMSGDQFFIRGLSAKNDVFTDGLRDFGVYTRDSFNYGQVEVFKGPSASAFGRGAAGGGINTSSKTPYGETGGSLTVMAGEGEYQRVTGDWNQTLGDGMAARLAVMAHHNANTGRDHIYSDRWGVAPSVGFGLGDDTSMTIAYLHQDEEKVPDYGIPAVNVGGISVPVTDYGVDPTNFYGFATDIDKTTVDTFTARLRHTVNDWLSLTSDTKYGYYTRYSQYTPTTCGTTTSASIPVACNIALTDGNPATIPLGSVGGPGPYDQDTNGVQNISTASVTAPIGGLRNELLVGFDVSWQHNDRNGYGAYTSRDATKDLLNPVLGATPVRGPISNVRDTTAKDVSVFVTDRLWFSDQWSVTAGLRQAWYEVDQTITNVAAATCNGVSQAAGFACRSGSNTEFLTPQVGVIFEPTQSQNYYVSYASSAKPPGVSVGNGDTIAGATPTTPGSADFDPEESTNIEAGARVGLFGDKMQLQGAIFQTRKDNAKESDPLGNILRSGDSQEITGLEVGVGGAITDQWSITANYTWLDTETTDSSTAANIGKQVAFTPEQAASLWTTYNFLGGLEGLEIGGGVTYQGEVYLNAANTGISPSYTTLDGLVSYGFNRYRLSLNAYNLTDELYFAQVHGNRLTPGQGRTFIATLGVVF